MTDSWALDSWPDLEHDATVPQPPPIAASPRGAPSRAECSVDLKLGGLGEFGAVADGTKEPAAAATATATAAPSASPMKRPRSGPGGAAGAQCPSCAGDPVVRGRPRQDGHPGLETLLNLLQETALNHVWMSGLLGDGFGATHRNNLIWVVSRMHVQVDQYPIW